MRQIPPAVRNYRASDREEVIALWRATFPADPPWNKPADLIRNKLGYQPDWFFVCHCDNQLAGTIIVGYDGVRGWVHKVAAHPSFRRRGIASALMKAAENALQSVGCLKLNLQVRADNHSAIAFYQEAGYAIEDRVSMSKQL